MKKFLTIFFVTLGVIFFILILFSMYFWVTDPFNLKPLLFGSESGVGQGNSAQMSDQNPALSVEQAKVLESAGIDPAAVPAEFTPEQVQCFEEKLGVARVQEISAGATPSALEILTARDCL